MIVGVIVDVMFRNQTYSGLVSTSVAVGVADARNLCQLLNSVTVTVCCCSRLKTGMQHAASLQVQERA